MNHAGSVTQDEFGGHFLEAFEQLDEAALNSAQLERMATLRREFPDLRVGRKDGKLYGYLLDPEVGPIFMRLP